MTCTVFGSARVIVILYSAVDVGTAYCSADWKQLWRPKGATK